jgi:hypothetical protein
MSLECFPPLTLRESLGCFFLPAHQLLHALVVIVHGDTEHLLRTILTDDILIEILL